jgi:hypothetical protein
LADRALEVERISRDSARRYRLPTEGDDVEGQNPNCHQMRTPLKSRTDVVVLRVH